MESNSLYNKTYINHIEELEKEYSNFIEQKEYDWTESTSIDRFLETDLANFNSVFTYIEKGKNGEILSRTENPFLMELCQFFEHAKYNYTSNQAENFLNEHLDYYRNKHLSALDRIPNSYKFKFDLLKTKDISKFVELLAIYMAKRDYFMQLRNEQKPHKHLEKFREQISFFPKWTGSKIEFLEIAIALYESEKLITAKRNKWNFISTLAIVCGVDPKDLRIHFYNTLRERNYGFETKTFDYLKETWGKFQKSYFNKGKSTITK